MCVACGFISFWDTKCHTPFMFPLRVLHQISRSRSVRYYTDKPLSIILYISIWLRSHTHIFDLNFNFKCLYKNRGRRYRYLSLYQRCPYKIVYFPSSSIIPSLPMKFTSFVRCLIVLIFTRRQTVRSTCLSSTLLLIILMEIRLPVKF